MDSQSIPVGGPIFSPPIIGPQSPDVPNALMREDGGFFLREDSGFILRESQDDQ